MTRAAIYAGTFDPLTMGHLDVIRRAAKIFAALTVAVAENPMKRPMFSLDERVAIVEESVAGLEGVTVKPFSGLLVEYARRRHIHVLVRGLRAISDFEFEFQMALTNRSMAPEIETLFLMPKDEYSYLTSSTVREIAVLGGDYTRFVPEPSRRALEGKVNGHAEEKGAGS